MTDVAEIFRYYGFKEEAVRGVAEASAEMHCDAKSLSPGMPDDPEMTFEGSMGRGKNIHRPGYYVSSPSAEVGTDIKILNRFMEFALGECDTLQAEGAGDTLTPGGVWYYDDSGDTFTSDLTDFTDVDVGDVAIPGHAAAEVDDYLAIGYQDPFTSATFVISTAKTDTSTLVWEYWDGDEWKAIPSPTDATTGFTAAPGSHTLTFTEMTDWIPKKISTDTTALYYIRVRCSAFTSAGTAGLVTSGTLGVAPDITTDNIYSTESVLLPSFTSFIGMDVSEHIISGCVVDTLEMKADGDFLTLNIGMNGQTPTLATLKAQSALTMNDDYPLAFYEVNLYSRPYGDTTPWGAANKISSDVKSLTFKVENSTSSDDGKRIGSRFPGYISSGARNITASFDSVYLDNDWLELMWGSSDGPQEMVGSTDVEFMIEVDAGRYGYVQIYLPRAIVKAPVDSSGRDPITQTVDVDAFMDSVTFTGSAGATTVTTDCLATFVMYTPDT
jgi:hypothetical protein